MVVTPPTYISYETDLDEERRQGRERDTERHNKRSHGTGSTSLEGDTQGKRKASDLEESEVRLSGAEADSNNKSRYLSSRSGKSEKTKVLRPEISKFLTYSDFNTCTWFRDHLCMMEQSQNTSPSGF